MVNNNYPQITSVTSEALQVQLRTLLPSQEGFGTDLMAQNVIVPIIDLTRAAEGSSVPQNLQTAMAFGSQTSFSENASQSTIANTTGFWRIFGLSVVRPTSVGGADGFLALSNGLTNKNIFLHNVSVSNNDVVSTLPFDFVVFLAAGESLIANSGGPRTFLSGTVRQIADVNGTLVNPSGFNPQ